MLHCVSFFSGKRDIDIHLLGRWWRLTSYTNASESNCQSIKDIFFASFKARLARQRNNSAGGGKRVRLPSFFGRLRGEGMGTTVGVCHCSTTAVFRPRRIPFLHKMCRASKRFARKKRGNPQQVRLDGWCCLLFGRHATEFAGPVAVRRPSGTRRDWERYLTGYDTTLVGLAKFD